MSVIKLGNFFLIFVRFFTTHSGPCAVDCAVLTESERERRGKVPLVASHCQQEEVPAAGHRVIGGRPSTPKGSLATDRTRNNE